MVVLCGIRRLLGWIEVGVVYVYDGVYVLRVVIECGLVILYGLLLFILIVCRRSMLFFLVICEVIVFMILLLIGCL